MRNCCVTLGASGQNKQKKNKKKPNPFATDFGGINGKDGDGKLLVLKDPTVRDISTQNDLGRELGRGQFEVTYLCTEASSDEKFACKSISKKKLRTAVDIEDVRREVEIMRHLPPHPNIVTLKDTYEDDDAVHIVMELCEGETEQGVAQAIIRSVIDFKRDPWPRVSDTAKDLVKKMLDPDPKKRLTDHPWIQNAKTCVCINDNMNRNLSCMVVLQDGRISYEEFAAMVKAGTDWRKPSRQYSRERFNSIRLKLMREGSLQLANEGR